MTAPAPSLRDELVARARVSFHEHKGDEANLCPIHGVNLCWTLLEMYAILRDAKALTAEEDIFFTEPVTMSTEDRCPK